MPLILKVDGPVSGTLGMPPTWAQLFSTVPNLVGAWDSASLSTGPLSSWPASYGAGLLRQTVSGAQPSVIDNSGRRVVSYALGKRLDLQGALTSGGQITVAMRVNMTDISIDNQALFGGSSTWRTRYRNNTGGTVNTEAGGGTINSAMTANGWHNVVVVQDSTTATLIVDGGAPVSRASSGALITSLAIGGLAGNDTTTNWMGHIDRIAIATSGLSGSSLETFNKWVSL